MNILILGGSGRLGLACLRALKQDKSVNVRATYYKNKPKGMDDSFYFFDATTDSIDEEIMGLISNSDVILNFITVGDDIDQKLTDNAMVINPIKMLSHAIANNAQFFTFSHAISPQSFRDKCIDRLSDYMEDTKGGLSIVLPLIVSKNCNIYNALLFAYKLRVVMLPVKKNTKVRAIHINDFCEIMSGVVKHKYEGGRASLCTAHKSTIGHVADVLAQSTGKTPWITTEVDENKFIKITNIMSKIIGHNVSKTTISLMKSEVNYPERVIAREPSSINLDKPLRLSSRLSRDGI